MTLLILGLLLFLGVHSTRIVAERWRGRMIARIGAGRWKAAYAVLSIVGFVLLLWGYRVARLQPVVLWDPPAAMRHLAALLTVPAFVLVVAAYIPGNGLRARLHHPMLLGVKLWALAHLLANRTLAAELTFAAFLVWAVLAYRAARARDRAAGTVQAPGRALPTVVTLVVGLAAWAGFAFWLHGRWIGVRPFG